jgi:hypothetical protein
MVMFKKPMFLMFFLVFPFAVLGISGCDNPAPQTAKEKTLYPEGPVEFSKISPN